ncbi:MAG: hypothetical protein R3F14_45505 [Polyangiaceae bacterium]
MRDPDGARLGLVTMEEEPPEHAGPMPDGAFCWYEVLSRTPAKTAPSMRRCSGGRTRRCPLRWGLYRLFRRGEIDAAGMMAGDAGGAAAWTVYMYTADIEAALAKVAEARGEGAARGDGAAGDRADRGGGRRDGGSVLLLPVREGLSA